MALAGRPILLTPPAVELSLSLVKSYLRVDYSDDDTLIALMIQSARERCEHYCNRKFINQVWQVYYDKIDKRFEIPFPPIQAVNNFKLIYLNEVIALVENSDYYILNKGGDAFVILTATTYNLPPGFSLGDDLWRFNVRIDVTCGFDTQYTQDSMHNGVPSGIQEAILKTVYSAYFSPKGNAMGVSRQGILDVKELPEDAKRLLQPYKNVTI